MRSKGWWTKSALYAYTMQTTNRNKIWTMSYSLQGRRFPIILTVYTNPSVSACGQACLYAGGHGILGCREFNNYLASGAKSDAAYSSAVAELKLNTRRYAQRQVKWIRNKLLPAIHASSNPSERREDDENISAFLLDASGASFLFEPRL